MVDPCAAGSWSRRVEVRDRAQSAVGMREGMIVLPKYTNRKIPKKEKGPSNIKYEGKLKKANPQQTTTIADLFVFFFSPLHSHSTRLTSNPTSCREERRSRSIR